MTVKRRHGIRAGGFCIFPKWSQKIAHRCGIRCHGERRPACGAKLLREGSHHHRLFQGNIRIDTTEKFEIIPKGCFLKGESMACCGIRVTTALPEDNARVVAALRELL